MSIATAAHSAARARLLSDHSLITRHPTGIIALRSALRNGRGEANGAVRRVLLDWASAPASRSVDELTVIGPTDGRPLVIEVTDGAPELVITSGHVIVTFDSASGSGCTVMRGAMATIFVEAGRQVAITARSGSTVHLHGAPGSSGSHSLHPDATFVTHGDVRKLSLSIGLGVSDALLDAVLNEMD